MKIKREDFRILGCRQERVAYIKEKQPMVRDVFSECIYFINSHHSISWGFERISDKIDDIFLKAINAACNTEFEFED